MNKLNFTSKSTGDVLNASEWNLLVNKTDELVDAVNSGTGSSASNIVSVTNDTADGGDPSVGVSIASGVTEIGTPKVIGLTKKKKGVNTTILSENNINLEPRESAGAVKGGNISLKPGDDIELCSHHRLTDNQDEVSVKVIDGKDNPVKLQLNLSEITLTTKDKLGDNADVLDVAVNSAKDTRGYLKVRAQAIDLRCEKHGGIALQPKGFDEDGHMNKIKFEHGGGDGLEFGTFSTEKSSLYTDEYRFKKDGVWKMATRTTEQSGKTIRDEGTIPTGKMATGALKYTKLADDFYDIINPDDETATTNSIIKTAHALNDGKNRHAKYEEKVTTSGNLKKTLEIETVVTIQYESVSEMSDAVYNSDFALPSEISDPNKIYTISDFKDAIKTLTVNGVAQKYGVAGESGVTVSAGDIVMINGSRYRIVENFSPSIDITSGADLSLKAKEGTLTLGGDVVEFGSDTIELGEMEDGLYAQYKLTKKNNSKPCDTLKIKVVNNQTTPLAFDPDSGAFAIESFYPTSSVTIPAKIEEPTTDAEANQHIQVVAQCKLYDVIKFVAWAKNNNFGPWAN